jgi:RimJ/RimL family protein N-acetyltransferase
VIRFSLMRTIEPPILIEISRFQDGTPAYVTSAHEGSFGSADVDRVVEICSEQEIYDVLFRRLFKGAPYARTHAEGFREFCYAGWRDRSSFVFLIRDSSNRIVGAMDIKSTDRDASEIGYWASRRSPGYMTNALTVLLSLARDAGYRSLNASTLLDNTRSQQLLGRVGFSRVGTQERSGTPYARFRRHI